LLELLLGKGPEALVITGLRAFSCLVGETQELRARIALGYLRRHLQITAQAYRDEKWQSLPARELVPGDLVNGTVGDIVPADCTIHEGTIEVDQGSLTGGSLAVGRSVSETFYSGSTVRQGKSIGTVTATGINSYFGRTVELVRTGR